MTGKISTSLRHARAPRWGTRAGKANRPSAASKAGRLPVTIVGVGRIGGALALHLKRAGWPVNVFPHSGTSVRRAGELGLPIADQEALSQSSLCLFCVPDAVISNATASMLEDLHPQASLVHCSGALTLEAFGTAPALGTHPRGSFHPLCAVSHPQDSLAGNAVALAATDAALGETLRNIARDLGMHPFEVPEEHRHLYHAGAVLCAGGLISLLSAGVETFVDSGIERPDALEALVSLMQSALRRVADRGLKEGITGPVPRGDVATVRANLGSLPKQRAALYRLLSQETVQMLGKSLSPKDVDEKDIDEIKSLLTPSK